MVYFIGGFMQSIVSSKDEAPVATSSTLCDIFAATVARSPSEPALDIGSGSGATTLSWADYRETVLHVAASLHALGGHSGDTLAIFAGNRHEHLLADMAAMHCGMVSVSMYQTLAPAQLDHIIQDSKPWAIVVEGPVALQRLKELPAVQAQRPTFILLPGTINDAGVPSPDVFAWADIAAGAMDADGTHREAVEALSKALPASSPAICIYTSGTTGRAKGVMLSHAAIIDGIECLLAPGVFDFDYRYISYLPLAHIAERLMSLYLPIRRGGRVAFCADQAQLLAAFQAHRPTFVFGVPRVWEKLRSGIEQMLAMAPPEMRQPIEAGLTHTEAVWHQQKANLSAPHPISRAAGLVRHPAIEALLAKLGLDRVAMSASSAAPLNRDVSRFFGSIGLPIMQGYGLTETGGVAVADRPDKVKPGSVGRALPGIELRVAEDGELLVRSPANCTGYRNLDNETALLYTSDGWLRTGDIGHVDEEGFVFITDRKKELIINSAGKNIAPTAIEGLVAGRAFASQVLVHGDARPYLVALVVPDMGKLVAFARSVGISTEKPSELVRHPEIRSAMQKVIEEANAQLSRPEQIKRFIILEREWGPATGELTPTFKLRRRVIEGMYAAEIAALYS